MPQFIITLPIDIFQEISKGLDHVCSNQEELNVLNSSQHHNVVDESSNDSLYRCAICSHVFMQESSLMEHMVTHTYKCNKCNKINIRNELLYSSHLCMGVRSVQCNICRKTFISQRKNMRRGNRAYRSNIIWFSCYIAVEKHLYCTV